MFLEKQWDGIAKVLRDKFGLDDAYVFQICHIRDELRKLASGGISTAPDFTLHNEIHSDNLVLLLGELSKLYDGSLSEYEAFLLAASAYLHDVGMFLGAGRFKAAVLPELSTALRVCECDQCDGGENYKQIIAGKPIDYQIRALHHLLSAYLISEDGDKMFRLARSDQPHVIAISRGHRKANIRDSKCDCYKTVSTKQGLVRRDLLAALLRLADALDFYPDRTPEDIFITRAWDFIQNPMAMKHWLNHYFATNVYLSVEDQDGNRSLGCRLTYVLPSRSILNGKTYEEFFSPLFMAFVEDGRHGDFCSSNYPNVFFEFLRIRDIQFIHNLKTEFGSGGELPKMIISEIEQSGCMDALQFINYLEDKYQSPPSPSSKEKRLTKKQVMDRQPEIINFDCMLNGEDTQHPLMLLVGGPGQGKSFLVKSFEDMCIDQNIACLKLDLSNKSEYKDILDGIWQRLGASQFPQYSVRREKWIRMEVHNEIEGEVELSNIFFTDWKRANIDFSLVILLDTFERASPGLKNWIETKFLEGLQNIPSVLIVIGGRQWPKINEYWHIHSHLCPLEGVKIHHYREYAAYRGLHIPEDQLITLHRVMQGLPKLFVEFVDDRLRAGA